MLAGFLAEEGYKLRSKGCDRFGGVLVSCEGGVCHACKVSERLSSEG